MLLPAHPTYLSMALPEPVASFPASSRVHAVLDKRQLDDLACFLDLDVMASRKVQQFLDARGPRLCLIVYSSDGTPARFSKSLVYKVPSDGVSESSQRQGTHRVPPTTCVSRRSMELAAHMPGAQGSRVSTSIAWQEGHGHLCRKENSRHLHLPLLL